MTVIAQGDQVPHPLAAKPLIIGVVNVEFSLLTADAAGPAAVVVFLQAFFPFLCPPG
jgi:hypothetical protein